MTETEDMKAQLSQLEEELKNLKEAEEVPAEEPAEEAEVPAEEVAEPVEEEKPVEEPVEAPAEEVAESEEVAEKVDISEIKESIGKVLKELKTMKESKVKLKGKIVKEKADSELDNYMFEKTEFGKGFSMYEDPAKLDAKKYQRLVR